MSEFSRHYQWLAHSFCLLCTKKKCMVSKLNLCSLSSEIDRQNRNKVAVQLSFVLVSTLVFLKVLEKTTTNSSLFQNKIEGVNLLTTCSLHTHNGIKNFLNSQQNFPLNGFLSFSLWVSGAREYDKKYLLKELKAT